MNLTENPCEWVLAHEVRMNIAQGSVRIGPLGSNASNEVQNGINKMAAECRRMDKAKKAIRKAEEPMERAANRIKSYTRELDPLKKSKETYADVTDEYCEEAKEATSIASKAARGSSGAFGGLSGWFKDMSAD